jgi:acyl carrier protein
MQRLPNSPEEILETLLKKQARPDIGEYAAPRDELERAVCELWSDVLQLERVGRDDNFLELGGDSFHMAVIGARLTESYGLEIQIADFFEHATVADMVVVLRARLTRTN